MAGRFTIEAVFSAVDRMTAPVRRIERSSVKSLQRLQRSMDRADRAGRVFTGTMAKVGVAGGVAAVAVGAGAANVARAGAEFEQAITNVGAVSLKSRDQIADLEAKALDLGATTKFTATEVANGMELMAKAGFENADILSGIGGVLDAAAADGGELAETASTVSNVLKGMGLEASQAGRVADVLALASSRTNSSINTLGESMRNVSSTARQFGVQLEDSVAVVALLQDVGLDASVAGSAFNVMLTKLAKPPANVAREMKRMGVSFQDARGNMLPLSEVLANIDRASKGAGGNMKAAALLADLVGLRGQKAAANLQKLFESGKFSTLAHELQWAEGSAAKMAEIKMNSTTGDWLKLGAAVDAVKIALFNTENGPLRSVLQSMTRWVDTNKALLVAGFQDFMTFVRTNGEAIADVFGRVVRVGGLLLGVAFGFRAAALATALWTAALTANPLTLWIVALTALGALVAAFWPEISAFLQDVGGKVAAVGALVWDQLVSAWGGVVAAVGPALGELWAVVKPVFAAWWDLQVRVTTGAVESMGVIAAAIGRGLRFAWGVLEPFFVAWLRLQLGVARTSLTVMTSIASAITSALKWAWGAVEPFFAAWKELVVGLSVVAHQSMGRLVDAVKSAMNALGAWLSPYWAGVVQVVGRAASSFAKVWDSTLGTFREAFLMAWDFVRTGFLEMVGLLRPIWDPLLEGVFTLAEAIVGAFHWAGDTVAAMWAPVLEPIAAAIDEARGIGRLALGVRGEPDTQERGAREATAPPVPSPQESIARSITERTEKTQTEVLVRAEQGTSARVSRRGASALAPHPASGAFE